MKGSLAILEAFRSTATADVYLADVYNNRIQKFTSDGSFLTEWGETGSGNGQFKLP